ncbi:MAG: DUF6512 family protein [Lachnospira sp.]|nr:DUF6512 family protein [Lachnospira sp.]
MTSSLKPIQISTIVCLIVASALGVLLHFAYEFTGNNAFIALFCPVNESTWEHMKLLFFPILLVLLIQYAIISYIKSSKINQYNDNIFKVCYIEGTFVGIVYGLVAIFVLFYSILGLIGFNVDWINIAIYFVSIILAFYKFYSYIKLPSSNTYTYHYNKKNKSSLCGKCGKIPAILCVIAIVVIMCLFFIFTYYPPHIGLFVDPVTGSYGINF